jgi:hypothetical protein
MQDLPGETPPQAQVLMETGTFSSPNASFTVSVVPVESPAPAPVGQALYSNVYRIQASTATGAQLTPASGTPPTIILRSRVTLSGLTIARLDGNHWAPIKSFSGGCGDSLIGVSAHLGEFVVLGPAQRSSSLPHSGVPASVIAGLVLAMLAVAAGLFALTRARRTHVASSRSRPQRRSR